MQGCGAKLLSCSSVPMPNGVSLETRVVGAAAPHPRPVAHREPVPRVKGQRRDLPCSSGRTLYVCIWAPPEQKEQVDEALSCRVRLAALRSMYSCSILRHPTVWGRQNTQTEPRTVALGQAIFVKS